MKYSFAFLMRIPKFFTWDPVKTHEFRSNWDWIPMLRNYLNVHLFKLIFGGAGFLNFFNKAFLDNQINAHLVHKRTNLN